MCPYCGEDVPAGSKSCWKCGFELGEDSDTTPPGEGAPEIEQRRKAPPRPQQPCPSCGKAVSVGAIRCNHCGAQLIKGSRNWVPLVWTAFGLVLLATVAGLLYNFFASHEAPPDPGRSHPIDVLRPQLAKIYQADHQQGRAKKQALWKERHRGKFVRWTGYLLEIGANDELILGDSPSADRKNPHVVVVLKDSNQIEARGLKRGKSILYSARLDRFEGGTFYLDLGVLEE